MGRKYASIHIHTGECDGIEFVNNTFANVVNEVVSMDENDISRLLGLGFGLDEQQSRIANQFIAMAGLDHTGHTAIEHNGYLSLSDDRMTFENIEEISLRISAILHGKVFCSAAYDDDVFVFSIYDNGAKIASSISGNSEIYGIKSEEFGLEYLEQFLMEANCEKNPLQGLCGEALENAIEMMIGFSLAGSRPLQ